MSDNLKKNLANGPITASAPCRVDMGGTLDIKTIYLPMAHLSSCTFNIALDLRTHVTLHPYKDGLVKVSSRGFDSVDYPIHEAPLDHPLGLMFAIAAYFNVDGVHMDINSTSPPRSALGGSSVASVALIKALVKALNIEDDFPKDTIALTAHAIEEGVARVPCGIQDQLAAAFGGVNAWYWQSSLNKACFEKKELLNEDQLDALESSILIAYCGIPHESKDINGKWMDHFLSAENRDIWKEIINSSTGFVKAISEENIGNAISFMNSDVDLRKQMTPEVLDKTGEALVASARETNCAARFTGAGGGGCIWAIGEPDDIVVLRNKWAAILDQIDQACLLDAKIDRKGVV